MKKEYELIHHAKMKHLHLFTINITYRNFHAHSDFEFLLILDGSGKIQVKNDAFDVKCGDCILINPNEMHEFDASDGGLTMIIMQFSRHFLNDYFPVLRNTRFLSPLVRHAFCSDEYADFLKTVVTLAVNYIEGGDFFALDCLWFATNILKCLYRKLPYEILSENAYEEHKKRSDRISRISSYIDDNYLYPIRLQDIAEREQISVTHLSHFFTENFGITFQEYLNDKRLEQALRLAGVGSYSLAALSELSGFSDPKYLSKTFLRKFGYSFQEYKKNIRHIPGQSVNNTQTLQYYHTSEESLTILNQFLNAALFSDGEL